MRTRTLIRLSRVPMSLLIGLSFLVSLLPTFLPGGAAPVQAAATTLVVSSLGIDAFELADNKLAYWGHSLCVGLLQDQAQIRRRFLNIASTDQAVQPTACNVTPLSRPYVVRDDYFFYYFAGTNGTRLVRKLAVADADTPPTVIATVPAVTSRAGLDLRDGYLYWSSYIPATNASVIYRMKADLSEPPLSITGGAGEITWLKSLRLRNGSSVEDALVWRTDVGLYRWRSAVNPPFGNVLPVATGDFVDGALAFTGNTALSTSRSYLLAVRSDALLRIDLFNGQSETIYAAPASRTLHAVAVDPVLSGSQQSQRQIFLTERGGFCPIGGSCVDVYRIKRRPLNATNWNVNEWLTIVDSLNGPGGINLRSDGKRLYYLVSDASPTEIRSIPVDAAPQLLNIAAIGIEAVQSVQSLNNDVTLVARRETLVRGYAYLTVNTTNLSSVRPSAILHVWRNDKLLGSLHPINEPLIDTTSDLAVLRADPDRSYLFNLPLGWTHADPGVSSQLRMEFIVNYDNLVEESVLDPTSDNRVSANDNDPGMTMTIWQPEKPCLVLVRVYATGAPVPSIFPWQMPDIIARARSYLPVTDLKVFVSPIILDDGDDPFSLNDDDSDVLAMLSLIAQTSDDLDGCTETFYAGMVHQSASWEWGGLALGNSNVLLFKIAKDAISPWNEPGGGTTLAHELGHIYGRPHVQCADDPDDWKGQDDFETNYPYPICQISYSNTSAKTTHFGFDQISFNEALNAEERKAAVIAPAAASDLMSYKRPRWVSPFFWEKVLQRILIAQILPFAAATPAAATDALMVQGHIAGTGDRGLFRITEVLPETAVPRRRTSMPEVRLPASIGRSALLRLRDARGGVLAEHPLRLDGSSRHGPRDGYTFNSMVPFPVGTAQIELLSDGRVLDRRQLSANAPTVRLNPPQIAVAQRAITLSWNAEDADGDRLRTSVQYSHDGSSWQTILVGLEASQATLSMIGLAGGPNAQFRVLTSDGGKVGVSPGIPLQIPNNAPVVSLSGIVSGQHFETGKILKAFGIVLDYEDGALEPQWELSGPMQLSASGPDLTLAGLEPGSYTLTLHATDSAGLKGSSSVNFTIKPLLIPTLAPPVFDGSCNDAVYDNALVIRPYNNGGEVSLQRAWLLNTDNGLFVCFTGMNASNAAYVAQVGLYVDPNASGDINTKPDDIGFIVRDDGEIAQFVDVGAGIGLHLEPQPGYQARIVNIGSHWSAEMHIQDSLLGGNPLRTRMMIQFAPPSENFIGPIYPRNANPNIPLRWALVYIGSAPMIVNQPPLADTGIAAPYWPARAKTIYLDATGSIDPEGDNLSYQWKQISGPAVRLYNADQALAGFDAAPVQTPTRLVFELTVSDGARTGTPREFEVLLYPPMGASGLPVMEQVYVPLIRRE